MSISRYPDITKYRNPEAKQMPDNNYIFIAGPCAAESEQQLLDIAHALQNSHIDYFRAGLWKPRTSPFSFQGVGENAIGWMQAVKRQYGLKICTEVATPEHVALCRENDFDALWIGARTVSDPFAMQALCDALSGYQGWVMVKNPITDDVDLWEGALQRLRLAGIDKLIAVHRGTQSHASQQIEMRNNVSWSMPIELRRRMSDLTIICDPSHIAGRAELVPQVAQQAISLGLDGLMVEVHNSPDKALSDKAQQLTPTQFISMLHSLNYRHQSQPEQELLQLREQIDNIDTQLWQLIEQRLQVSEQIGEIKQQHGMPIFQPERYQQILEQRLQWAEQQGISRKAVSAITQALHEASVEKQMT